MSKFSRAVETKNALPSILIVCEGQRTEPNYFKSFPVVNKTVIKGTGRNTLSLVDYAISEKKKGDYDQTWCVFDEDSRTQDFDNAIKKCSSNDIFPAYSNESFELWYVLHFEDIQSYTGLTRHQYCSKLDAHLPTKRKKDKPKYCKNDENNYNRLLPYQDTAIQRAKRLESQYPISIPFHQRKPITSVHKLVEELNKFLK